MNLLVIGAIAAGGGIFYAARQILSLVKGKDMDIDFGEMKFTKQSDGCCSSECSI